MPTSVPLTTKNPGDVLTSSLWNAQLKQNLDKLLNAGHRTLTVAQFAALTGLEGTKGVVAGDEVYLEVDATNGVLWHLVYESTETTYKWRYLGGPPLSSEIATSETVTSTTYVDLATVGPTLTMSRAGDYELDFGAQLDSDNGASGDQAMWASPKIGAATAADVDAAFLSAPAGTRMQASVSRRVKKTCAASDVVKLQYRTGAAFAYPVKNRWLKITPTRLI